MGAHFIEGDRLHPKANVEKMSAGIPLTDEDRWPWLGQVGASVARHRRAHCLVLGVETGLSRTHHRSRRTARLLCVSGWSRELLEQRIAARKGHFMPPSLLASQLATLERPAPDERAKAFDIARPVEEIVAQASAWLLQQQE